MRHNTLSSSARARGFTLVETLVTVIVLSVGLLGIAALQLTSMKNMHGSANRTHATILASDIIDRMRANRRAAVQGQYNIAFRGQGVAGTLAGDDLLAWKRLIRDTLPAGDLDGDGTTEAADGAIRYDNDTQVVTVTVAWGDSRKGSQDEGDGTALQFQFQTRLSN